MNYPAQAGGRGIIQTRIIAPNFHTQLMIRLHKGDPIPANRGVLVPPGSAE